MMKCFSCNQNAHYWVRALTATALLCGSLAVHAATLAQRIDAARDTATYNASCNVLFNFYWEIGGAYGMLANGSQGLVAPNRYTQLAIYSAGKWVYAAYVYEQHNGNWTPDDKRHLRMLAGYTETSQCYSLFNTLTVGQCFNRMSQQNTDAIGVFHYGPAQLQSHAVNVMGLASDDRFQLGNGIHAALGNDFTLTYDHPQVAGGARSSAGDYAVFLQKLLNGDLLLGSSLGSDPVCTTCDKDAFSPVSLGLDEDWHYSYGHWVEDDPGWIANGGFVAFSSPGYGGFYPWIDGTRTYYGILARSSPLPTASAASVKCGREIRKAWLTGQAQL